MGADKATLMIAGKPLWERQIETLRSMKPNRVLISARTRPAWTPDDIEVVLDEPPSQGPLSGLVAALKTIKTTHLLALAIDLPKMTSTHLFELWNFAAPGVGVMPRSGVYFEPLCAIYPASAELCAAPSLASGQLSLQSLAHGLMQQASIRIFSIAAANKSLYTNINSPEDLTSDSLEAIPR